MRNCVSTSRSAWTCITWLLASACSGERPDFPTSDEKSTDAETVDAGSSNNTSDANVSTQTGETSTTTPSVESSSGGQLDTNDASVGTNTAKATDASDATTDETDPGRTRDTANGAVEGGAGETNCAQGCLIADVCYSEGDQNPDNLCVVCNPGESQTRWTNDDSGRCDDGLYCTVEDRCSDGECVGDERTCDDEVDCNGVGTCDETANDCLEGEPTCNQGEFCDVAEDVCSSTCDGCLVAGNCYADEAKHPTDPCLMCDTSASLEKWSVAVNATCNDGDDCTAQDRCNDSGECVGTPTVNEAAGCECVGNADCDDQLACTANTCAEGACEVIIQSGFCVIDGACFAHNTPDPENPCRYCDAALNTTSWTNAPLATPCDDGLWCTGNDTCNGGTCVHQFPNGNRCAGTVGPCAATSCDEEARNCFAPSTQVCANDEQVRCADEGACGEGIETRQAQTFCSGSSTACDGEVEPTTNWTPSESCAEDEVCTENASSASCTTSVECVAFCDPNDVCWSHEDVSGLNYASAEAWCASQTWAGKDWVLPTVQEWLSVFRGCQSGVIASQNHVTQCVMQGCTNSACSSVALCDACDWGEGPGNPSPRACYWIPNMVGTCTEVGSSGFWSQTAADSGYHWVSYPISGYVSPFGGDGFSHYAKCVTAR